MPVDATLDGAEQAMAAHLPEVAIQKLNAFMASTGALDDALRERAELDLTRAMLDSGDAVGGLARLEFPASDQERFWKAEALSELGRWTDAEPIYEEARHERPRALRDAAAIGQAEALHAQGRDRRGAVRAGGVQGTSPRWSACGWRSSIWNGAIGTGAPAARAIEAGEPCGDRWRQYVEGRIYLAEDQAAAALEDFTSC